MDQGKSFLQGLLNHNADYDDHILLIDRLCASHFSMPATAPAPTLQVFASSSERETPAETHHEPGMQPMPMLGSGLPWSNWFLSDDPQVSKE